MNGKIVDTAHSHRIVWSRLFGYLTSSFNALQCSEAFVIRIIFFFFFVFVVVVVSFYRLVNFFHLLTSTQLFDLSCHLCDRALFNCIEYHEQFAAKERVFFFFYHSLRAHSPSK